MRDHSVTCVLMSLARPNCQHKLNYPSCSCMRLIGRQAPRLRKQPLEETFCKKKRWGCCSGGHPLINSRPRCLRNTSACPLTLLLAWCCPRLSMTAWRSRIAACRLHRIAVQRLLDPLFQAVQLFVRRVTFTRARQRMCTCCESSKDHPEGVRPVGWNGPTFADSPGSESQCPLVWPYPCTADNP